MNQLSKAAAILGRQGGKVKSARKAAAVRENGKKGGRPKKAAQSPKAQADPVMSEQTA